MPTALEGLHDQMRWEQNQAAEARERLGCETILRRTFVWYPAPNETLSVTTDWFPSSEEGNRACYEAALSMATDCGYAPKRWWQWWRWREALLDPPNPR